jgi:hypothetical protein
MLDMVEDKRFEMRTSEELLAKIDAWRREQPGHPPRATAVKRLIAIGLEKSAEEKKPRRK